MTTTSTILLALICSTVAFWLGVVCAIVWEKPQFYEDSLVALCKFILLSLNIAGVFALIFAAGRGLLL